MLTRYAGHLAKILSFFLIFGALSLAQAWPDDGRRVALVIGNGGYQHAGPLANPVNDADAMAKLFHAAGFATVVAKSDLNLRDFRHALADFEVLARDVDVAIVYYSGHGLEYHGQNYLVPIDAAVARDVDIDDETVPLDRVLKAVAGARRLKLVILDACRTDPFHAAAESRDVNRGFARIEPSEANELVAYAAKAGTVAADGAAGTHSPFTAALLQHLAVPGLDVELALRRVHDDVMAATHREQEPFYYGAMGGEALPLVAEPVVVSPPAAAPGVAASVEQPKQARLEAAPENAVGDCDRLAAAMSDTTRPPGVVGVDIRALDVEHAIPACRAALVARPDDPRIAFELGRALAKNGGHDDEVISLYRKSVAAGNTSSMVNLGNMAEHGKGMAKDLIQAALLYRKAAEAGNTVGMHNLAIVLEKGNGVAKDPAQALQWFRKSAEAGNSFSMFELGRFYARGIGGARNDAEAFKWFRKAAEAGNGAGMVGLGRLYASGRGTAKDPAQAAFWFGKAAEAGNAVGKTELDRLSKPPEKRS